MLRPLHQFNPEITLVPSSGIQFLHFGFNLDEIARGSAAFIERTTERRDEHHVRSLLALSGDDDRDRDILDARDPEDAEYSISKGKALEPFLGKWVPVPLLRLRVGRGARGKELYDGGPSTWARLHVRELDERDPDAGHTHRVILAVDTELADEDPGGEPPYLAPTPKDSADEREFGLAGDPEAISWFLRFPVPDEDGTIVDLQKWVDEWLYELFFEFKQAQRPNRVLKEEDFPFYFEHWARFLAMLRLLTEAIDFPKIRLLDTLSEDRRYQPIDVDLVLDVGNSRTCGILVENYPGEERVSLTNCYALAMRDLDRPELFYRRPFESRVEFSQPDFGKDHIARRSGRVRPAFLWPSLVRVGPEAARLNGQSEGTESLSGLSSPKRYLWDGDTVLQDWCFHGVSSGQSLPLIARSAFRFVNEAGDVITQVRHDEERKLRPRGETSTRSAIRPRFSRSALYGFMMTELFCHALTLINDPANRGMRKQPDVPRRLRNIILTLPSATPLQEQSIMRSRAEGAVRLLWSIMEWPDSGHANLQPPNVIVNWDEASCTQLVYLYEEIGCKLVGQIEEYLRMKGRPRPRAEGEPEEPSLRLACIDIGGGTSDLMVTTFYSEDNRALRPVQNFREGFRIAGDDLMAEVISVCVLPQLRDSLEAKSVPNALGMLRELVSGEVGDEVEQMRHSRRQFALQVLRPVALAMIRECEGLEIGAGRALALADVVGAVRQEAAPADEEAPVRLELPDEVVQFVEDAARRRGGDDWRLADVVFQIDPLAVDGAVRDVLGGALCDMLEVVDRMDCDILLLSGRPSRLPAILDIARESLVVPPDRVVPMHDLKVDTWYPYRNPINNRIADPKTTAAVGGMLCLLSDTRIPNFTVYTRDLFMRSTARFIGELESGGRIRNGRILFRDLDLDGQVDSADQAEVQLVSPVHIGFRQMPVERWPATPLYRLDFGNENARRRPTPFRVMLARREVDADPDNAQEKLRAEALKEAFVIEEARDAEGDDLRPSDVVLRFHTLGAGRNDYWLDTGIFRVM